MVENYTSALTAKGWSFTAVLEHVSQTIAATMQHFDKQVSQFLADSIVTAAEALGQVIAGDLGFGGLMKAILTQFASFLKNIGAQLIEFGVMIIAFKSALSSVLANPWLAIGVGAATDVRSRSRVSLLAMPCKKEENKRSAVSGRCGRHNDDTHQQERYGITGCTTNEISIPADAVLNIDSF